MNEIVEFGIELMEEIVIDMDWEEVRDDLDLLDMVISFDDDSFLIDCDEIFIVVIIFNISSFLGNFVDNLF